MADDRLQVTKELNPEAGIQKLEVVEIEVSARLMPNVRGCIIPDASRPSKNLSSTTLRLMEPIR
jgi:hypothetical protein